MSRRVYYPDIGWVDISDKIGEKELELYKESLEAINSFLAVSTVEVWQTTKLGGGQCTLPLPCKECPFTPALAKLQDVSEDSIICNCIHRSRLPFPEILSCCVQLSGIAQAACDAAQKERERDR